MRAIPQASLGSILTGQIYPQQAQPRRRKDDQNRKGFVEHKGPALAAGAAFNRLNYPQASVTRDGHHHNACLKSIA